MGAVRRCAHGWLTRNVDATRYSFEDADIEHDDFGRIPRYAAADASIRHPTANAVVRERQSSAPFRRLMLVRRDPAAQIGNHVPISLARRLTLLRRRLIPRST